MDNMDGIAVFLELSERRVNHSSDMATYMANLCPLLGRSEFARFGKSLGEPIRKTIEAVPGRGVR